MTEFELIRTFFASQPIHRADVIVGIGDDAAVLRPPPGRELVVTTDILIEGVHFLPGADPAALGHKALAVNLSDLAAMGAEPAWFLLNLTLPRADADWLRGFCAGLYTLARRYNMQLVGGNTARGSLAIAVEAHGFVSAGRALTRGGARPGDGVYVTGSLGDAGLALAHRLKRRELSAREAAAIADRLDRPEPRVEEGMALRGIATSAVDISDGLIADLGHILEASGVGARVVLEDIPLSATYRARLREIGWDTALAGGEDYELCFTAPTQNKAALERALPGRFTRIGEITAQRGLNLLLPSGEPYTPALTGHDHFAEKSQESLTE